MVEILGEDGEASLVSGDDVGLAAAAEALDTNVGQVDDSAFLADAGGAGEEHHSAAEELA